VLAVAAGTVGMVVAEDMLGTAAVLASAGLAAAAAEASTGMGTYMDTNTAVAVACTSLACAST